MVVATSSMMIWRGWVLNKIFLKRGNEINIYNNDYYQVFLVAGGWTDDYIASTETLVEGHQAWNFQKPLPTGRYGLRRISLLDTVIMTGKKS